MARPKSEDKRSAILAAATRVIASQGLGASTASIAQEAGVSNGSLFTYFATKAELLNQLYLELKTEMALGARDLPPGDVRTQLAALWSGWLHWATSVPAKRRALAQLMVSDEITAVSLQKGHDIMADIARLMDRSRADGPMKDTPLGLVVALMSALAETTIDYMLQDPEHADAHCQTAFEALWRMVA